MRSRGKRSKHSRLAPLVAVQPIYMHPFTAAKAISSVASLYERGFCINMVAGGFRNDLIALDDREPFARVGMQPLPDPCPRRRGHILRHQPSIVDNRFTPCALAFVLGLEIGQLDPGLVAGRVAGR